MKSKRSMRGKHKVLLDTTFLLPALGIEVEEEAMKVIPLFRSLEVYYLEVALLEAMWKITKIVDKRKYQRVKVGIEAIRNTYELIEPPPTAYIEALEIYRKGHRDYIDAIHYASAKALKMAWLTIDRDFIRFLEDNGYSVKNVVLTPKELEKIVLTNRSG